MSTFKPILFCFIGPGASGKSSICGAVLGLLPSLMLSISSTTRSPRPYEKRGREYNFIDREKFESDISQGRFLESAEFAGNLYGTGIENLETARAKEKHLLLDIEIQGVRSLRAKFPEQTVVVFICPPSMEILRSRFEQRASDSPERIEERLKLAKLEIREALKDNFSDYVIVNDNFDLSVKQAKSIVVAEQIKRSRVTHTFSE